jgi:WD40 repeat protein
VDASSSGRRLVFVDQFEETFTLCRDATERAAFAEALTALADRADTVVVLAVRADQLGRCAELADIADLISGNEVLVGPMRESELGRAIELPARRAGLALERGLADIIVGDVAGRAGALPLLSTALVETWERRHDRTLTLAGYRAAGGVNGALAHLAEDTYASLAGDARVAARRVLLRLCDASDDGPADLRRRLPLSDVVIDDDTSAAVERLAERRLVIVDRDTIEVAHEALLREWPRLAAWLDEDVQGRRVHRHLGDTARAWRAAGHDPSELYRGSRLDGALEWAGAHLSDLNESERTFLEASRAEADRQAEHDRDRLEAQARANRRLRALLAGVAVLLVVALVSGGLFVRQRDRAEGAARAARARELAGQATLALDEDPELAILLALQAVEATDTPTPDAVSALQQAIQTSRLLVRAEQGARYVDVTKDGSLLVTASSSDPRVAIVWDTATWTPLRSLPGPAEVQRVAISPDGTRLAVGYDASGLPADEPGVILWNPATGAMIDVLAGEGRVHSPTDFSPDGRLLAVVSTDEEARRLTVWDTEADAERFSAVAEVFEDATFLHDGRSVLVAEPTAERVVRYSVVDGRELQVIATPGFGPTMLALHPSGRLLAVTSQTSQAAELWEVETGERRWSVEVGDGGMPSWSPRGDRLAIAGVNESRIRVVDPDSGDDVIVLQGHASGSWGAAYLPDGDRLASVGYTGDLRIWDVSPDGPPELMALAPSGPPHSLTIVPDGTAAIVTTWDGTVERFATSTGAPAATLLTGLVSDLPVHPVLSPDGRRLGSVQQDTGQTLIRDLATLQTVAELPLCSNPMAFSPDASLVLLDGRLPCTSDLGQVPRFQPTAASVLRGRVVDLDSGTEILDLGERILLPGVFSPDGRYLAVVARTTPLGTVEIYDLTTRELISSREFRVGPFSLAFDPQSRWLAGGMEDGTVWVLDFAAVVAGTSQEDAVVFEKAAHRGGVVGLDISDDGVIASAARGETVLRLWGLRSGERLLELSTDRDPASFPIAQFSPDDSYLLYLDGGIIRRYDRDTDALIELGRDRLTRSFTEDECREHLGRSGCTP